MQNPQNINQQYINQPNQNQQFPMYTQEQMGLVTNNMGNQMFINPVLNPLEILGNSSQAYIYQEISLIESLGMCDVPNEYNVAVITKSGQKLMLFKCIENSGCCERNFCTSNLVSFKMDVNLYSTANKFAILDKPFSCACCCCCWPEILQKKYE